MVEEPAGKLRFDAEEVLVEFPAEGCAVRVPLTPVGGGLYRLDGVPVLIESAGYRDVIEAEPAGDGRLRFVRVAEPSGWRTFFYTVTPPQIHSERLRSGLRDLEERGGHWERGFGGLLYVCVPPDLDLDPTPWVE